MCGIAGGVRRGGLSEDTLRAMAGALAHRGPDGEGVLALPAFEREGDRYAAGLAHRRLSVFDPTPAGAQPMWSRSGRTALVLNGEIYNHPELRRLLPGSPWRSASDTEVLLELLERKGLAALDAANGIFAFAAWDAEERRLTLGRDRLGVKPLYYRLDKDGIAFASELRGLLAGPEFPRRPDPRALSAYLDFGYVPAPLAFLEGVRKLPPGAVLEWRDGAAHVRTWWALPAPPGGADPGWREALFETLVDAVRLQLRSDVPVGTFLSGGVDSTLLTALAVRERGPLQTFSVSFPEARACDESPWARQAARALGTRHREIAVTGEDVRRGAPAILASLDEPFADASLLPTWFLSGVARESVTVTLAGDGADELFAGYRRYGADRWLARWRRLPARRHLAPLLARLPDDRSTRMGEIGRRVRKVLEAESLDPAERAFALARLFRAGEKARLAPELAAHADAGRELLGALRARQGGRDDLDTWLRADLALGLPDDMLTKVDRASMAHGLEVRVPYLDHRFVERAAALPAAAKRRGRSGKAPLLDVFGGFLPGAIRRRAKAGFDAPVTEWLRGPLREIVGDTLGAAGAGPALLDRRAVRGLHDAHASGRADHAWRLWSLVVLSDWCARHGVA